MFKPPQREYGVDLRLHLADLSLSDTRQHLENLGVKRSCTAIHNRVQKADLQPAIGSTPNRVALDETVIRVDDAQRLETALARLGLRCQMCRHGNRNSERHAPLTARVYDAGDSVERVSREIKRRTSSFSNTFSHADPTTAEPWLQASAVW